MLQGVYNLDDLLNDLKENKSMALFLGTGVDLTDVYPDGYLESKKVGKEIQLRWNGLLEELIDNACVGDVERKVLGGFSNDLQAAVLKFRLGEGYIPIIQNWLYSRCNRVILEDSFKLYDQYREGLIELSEVPFYSLFFVAELILLQSSIRSVVTQNYDNFLSETIKILLEHNQEGKYPYRTINPIEVYDGWKDEKFIDDVLLIYHVHGFIPPTSEPRPKPESNHIVLSQEEFYEMSQHVYSWQNAVQLNYLTHYTCVFIGLSMEDVTSARILRHANLDKSSEKVYVLKALHNRDNEEERTATKIRIDYYDTQHVHILCGENDYHNMYHAIRQSVIRNKTKNE